MTVEIRALTARLGTVLALVRRLVCVLFHVLLEMALFIDSVATHFTREGLLSAMHLQMEIQTSQSCVGHVALVAFVRLNACVNPQMIFKVTLDEETTVTLVTCKGPLARMRAQVVVQTGTTRHPFAAFSALERLSPVC